MAIHEDVVSLIEYCEGCENVAFACEAHVSNGGTWPHLTIGFGHSGPDVKPGQQVTTSEARKLLLRDIAEIEKIVHQMVKTPLTQTQYSALCALVLHVRPGLVSKSKMLQRLNARDFGSFVKDDALADPIGPGVSGMAREWAEFRMIAGRGITPGLILRRAMELEFWFTGRWSVPLAMRRSANGVIALDSRLEHRGPDMFRPGTRGPMVKQLHESLAYVGFPVSDDAYTWATVEAVKAFQKAHGLNEDGVYGPETAAKLGEVVSSTEEPS